jgi:SAM-dependent methyltransferase/tetratricopeptide (TPR) repeat protein
MDSARSQHLQILIQTAFARYYAGETRDAEDALRDACILYPDALEPRVHLANLLVERKAYTQAAQTLEPCKDNPDVSQEYRWLVLCALWASGDKPQFLPVLEAQWQSVHATPERLRQMTEWARFCGHLPLAARLAAMSGQKRVRQEVAWVRRLSLFFRYAPAFVVRRMEERLRAGYRWKRLRILYEAAHHAFPDALEWPLKLARAIRESRDAYEPLFEHEKSWYDTALALQPFEPTAVQGKARVLFDMGLWETTLDFLDVCPKAVLPGWADKLKAACWANLGQYREAMLAYAQIAQQESEFAAVCQGWLLLAQGQRQKAVRCFHQQCSDVHVSVLADFFAEICQFATHENIDGQAVLDSVPIRHAEKGLEDEAPVEGVACPLCGRLSPRMPLWKDRTTGWIRSRCMDCSMISVAPLPTSQAIRALYDHAGRSEHALQRQYKEGLLQILHAPEKQCRRLPLYQDITQWGAEVDWPRFEESLGEPRRYLDVGCSSGKSVRIFSVCGWQAEGIDLDRDAISFGKEHGINVRYGTLDDLNGVAAIYHLITLTDVIEHVADPLDMLRRCYTLLAPGGLLYIKTPCADSLPHRFIGNAWLDAPEHLHFFSRKTLLSLVERCGFTFLSVKQSMDGPVPILHADVWQDRLYPRLLEELIRAMNVGDTVLMLAQKPMDA